MNQNKKVSRRIMIVSAGLVFSMAITPIQVSAAVSADVLQTAGVASILDLLVPACTTMSSRHCFLLLPDVSCM